MTNYSDLSNEQLLAEVSRLALRERQATAALIGCLMEVDARRLYLAQGYSPCVVSAYRAVRETEVRRHITAARVAFVCAGLPAHSGGSEAGSLAAGSGPVRVRRHPRAMYRTCIPRVPPRRAVRRRRRRGCEQYRAALPRAQSVRGGFVLRGGFCQGVTRGAGIKRSGPSRRSGAARRDSRRLSTGSSDSNKVCHPPSTHTLGDRRFSGGTVLAVGIHGHGSLVRCVRWPPAVSANHERPRAGVARVERGGGDRSDSRETAALLGVRPYASGPASAEANVVGRDQHVFDPRSARHRVRSLPRRLDSTRARASAPARHAGRPAPCRRTPRNDH